MAKGKKDKEVSCDILQIHGYLNDDHKKVVARVSWNGKPAKLDIRQCWEDEDGELKLGKGISLDEDEQTALGEILSHSKLPVINKAGKKAVDFSKIFDESEGIVAKRQAGETTVDGFSVLRRRPGVKIGKEK